MPLLRLLSTSNKARILTSLEGETHHINFSQRQAPFLDVTEKLATEVQQQAAVSEEVASKMKAERLFNEMNAFYDNIVLKAEGGEDKKPPKGFEKFFKKKEEREKDAPATKGKLRQHLHTCRSLTILNGILEMLVDC